MAALLVELSVSGREKCLFPSSALLELASCSGASHSIEIEAVLFAFSNSISWSISSSLIYFIESPTFVSTLKPRIRGVPLTINLNKHNPDDSFPFLYCSL